MATTPDLQEPQIAAARAQAWHQAGGPDQEAEPLLTLEAARKFLEEFGLVLFAPRPLGAPAPSLVEATLGKANPAATATDAATARGLVARMVAEGSAVALNLLGGAGDVPDFIVSASAFPFVFTLRGDKGWKRPPETSGAVKVTPLALRAYELLAEKGAMTVEEIVPEIGREVTESAAARAMNELWSLLRVFPIPQAGEGATQWELATARFSKAIKAGANAGQPTALSGLISLYLRQALVASEEEIASFLSPLTARSRVRDVVHGLVAGRQLSEAVIEGKTVLYIPDSLPDFASAAAAELPEQESPEDSEEITDQPAEAEGEEEQSPTGDQPERIRRFEAEAAGPASGPRPLRGKPAFRPGADRPSRRPAGERGAGRAGGGFGARPGGFGDRPAKRFGAGPRDRSAQGGGERGPRPERPADRGPRREEGSGGFRQDRGERPSFTRPWDEERRPRPEGGDERPRRPREPRETDGDRPRAPRPGNFERRPPSKPFRSDRPAGRSFERRDGAESAPRRDFPPRRQDGGDDRPRRPSFTPGEGRPPRPAGGFGRPDRGPRRDGAGDGDRRPSFGGPRRDRPSFDRSQGDRPGGFDRPRGDRPSFPRRDGDRPSFPRGDGDRPSFPRREGDRPSFPRRDDRAGGSDRPRFDRPRPDRGAGFGGDRPSRPPSGDRPFRSKGPGGFGGARSQGDRPGGDRRGPGGGGFRPRPGGGDRPGAPGGDRGRGGFGRKPSSGRPPFKGPGGPRTDAPRPRRPKPEDEA